MWSEISLINYSQINMKLFVPTARLRFGTYPNYGTIQKRSNCKPGHAGSIRRTILPRKCGGTNPVLVWF